MILFFVRFLNIDTQLPFHLRNQMVKSSIVAEGDIDTGSTELIDRGYCIGLIRDDVVLVG